MARQTKCVEFLPVDLTEVELKNFSELMADAWQAKGRAEDQLKSVSTTIKAEIQVNEGKISKYAELVHSKKEYRSIECIIEWDFKKKQKRILRNDTGDVVRTIALTDAEMQEELEVAKK